MDQQSQCNCPRFIYVDNQYLKFDIVSSEPKLDDLISDVLTDDTAIVVTVDSPKCEIGDRGVLYVDRTHFQGVMNKIWSFVDAYKSGTSVRKSVMTLINKLEQGRQQ